MGATGIATTASVSSLRVLRLGLLWADLVPFAGHAQQDYPVKPVRIVLGSTPGASPDVLARMIAGR
jgi:tripartite-type tricarboxylate transporter receptor subunit TctC